jgi:hypothetical protein
MSAPAAKHAEPNEPPTCIKCGDEYSLNDGCDVTDYCDLCAQEVAADLRGVLETIADFAPGNGDVCEIIAKKARDAIARATGEGQ